MKKFQFPLERVYRYHQQRLKQAELKLAHAAMEREAASGVVMRYQQQIEQACQLKESVGGLINPAIRANVMAVVEQLGKTLAAARERLKVAEQRFRETDRVRAEITQDVEGLTQLRDLRRHEHHEEVNRLLQIELDEAVMRKWAVHDADDNLLSAGLLE